VLAEDLREVHLASQHVVEQGLLDFRARLRAMLSRFANLPQILLLAAPSQRFDSTKTTQSPYPGSMLSQAANSQAISSREIRS
jgi:hypothetical protein